MNKYQAIIKFSVDDEFMSLIPAHREFINGLIEKNFIDQYVVSMESQQAWITISAENKSEVKAQLSQSPIAKYWKMKVEELVVVDGQLHRLPAVQLN